MCMTCVTLKRSLQMSQDASDIEHSEQCHYLSNTPHETKPGIKLTHTAKLWNMQSRTTQNANAWHTICIRINGLINCTCKGKSIQQYTTQETTSFFTEEGQNKRKTLPELGIYYMEYQIRNTHTSVKKTDNAIKMYLISRYLQHNA
jgi:hypothetical protein